MMATDFGVGAQKAAEPHAERLRMLVIAHGERDLKVFVGMESISINEMAFAQRASVSKNTHHFIVSWEQMHS